MAIQTGNHFKRDKVQRTRSGETTEDWMLGNTISSWGRGIMKGNTDVREVGEPEGGSLVKAEGEWAWSTQFVLRSTSRRPR